MRLVGFTGVFEENHVAIKSAPFRPGKTRPSFRAGRGPESRQSPALGPGLDDPEATVLPGAGSSSGVRGCLAHCPGEACGPRHWPTPARPEIAVARLATGSRTVSSHGPASGSASTGSWATVPGRTPGAPQREPQTVGVLPHGPGTWSRSAPPPCPAGTPGAASPPRGGRPR